MKTYKYSYDVIADAQDLLNWRKPVDLTQTPDGNLVYKFDELGQVLYSPVTETCVKTFGSFKSARKFLNRLEWRGITGMTSKVVY